jgi:N-methylhydantoinase A
MTYRIGVDIGGTFTDFALFDENAARIAIHKQLTTPDDPSDAVLEGVTTMLSANGVSITDVASLAHGTTLVTNSLIERKGAVTGMLVTRNFLDVLDMAREQRYDLFDLRLIFPEPLVPRNQRREITERVGYDGVVAEALDLGEAEAAVRELVNNTAIKALAICLLHSYANPAHEQAIEAMVRLKFPDLHVSTSADVHAGLGEWDRWTTATMNAYVQPLFDRYLGRIEGGLAELGFNGKLYIMTSSGGMLLPETARRYPVRMLESGPAAGVLMSAFHGRALDLDNVLSFDLGGTTAKGALVRGGRPLKTDQMEVARVHDFKRGSGLPARIPSIDMIEIGAGGGSIAWIDERGLLKVGPKSAGAAPGPACYGQGGAHASLTDANLMLGFLDPNFFLGGAMTLDKAAARRAITETVAIPLGLTVMRAAWGMHDIANEDVARAFRIHASERGFDYRQATMIAFGGSGPLQAMAIAAKLNIPRVIFPIGAGVMSAMGLLASPLSFEQARTRRTFIEDIDAATFADLLAPLNETAKQPLLAAGLSDTDIRPRIRLDMRYFGQGHQIEVTVPGDDPKGAFADLPGLFAERYTSLFGVAPMDEALEIVTWKVEVEGPPPPLQAGYSVTGSGSGSGRSAAPGETLKGTRTCHFGEEPVDTPVYDRYALVSGQTITGPALIEERESTCVITPGNRATVDEALNIVAELEA